MKRVFSRALGVLFVLFYVVGCVSEPVIEETLSDVVSEPLPEITEDPETEEKFADVEAVNEESSVDTSEEAPVAETNPYRNNKKKKRH